MHPPDDKSGSADVHRADLPAGALLEAYRSRGYTDCYVTEIARSLTLEQHVAAFYTTWLLEEAG
jgi:hypothetical protein